MFQYTFPGKDVMAELMAKMLWEIKAVHFRPEDPYKLASGMRSPVYIDCRKLISYPRIRSAVMDFAAVNRSVTKLVSNSSIAWPAVRPQAFPSQPSWPNGSACR